MKAIVLPLALCAALAGCADYGTVAYGGYPAYPSASYPYASSPYAAYPAYGYTYPDAGYLYGAPAVNLSIYGGGGRSWNHGDRHAHRHADGAGAFHPGTHALGAGPDRMNRSSTGPGRTGGREWHDRHGRHERR